MNRKILWIILLMALSPLSMAGVAYDVVYANGAPDGVSGAGVNLGYGAADDFSLSSNTTVSRAEIWVSANANGLASMLANEFYWGIFDGPAGTGANVLGFGQWSGTAATTTGNAPFGVPEYLVSFDITPTALSAGAPYWFLLFAGPSAYSSPFMLWESTSPISGSPAATIDNTTPTQEILDQRFDLAFNLLAEVPAPGVLLLMGVGIVAFAAVGRVTRRHS